MTTDPAATVRGNFIRDIIDADLESGKHTTVVTRFPPEPNGYLHIGHTKSICLNFGLARDYGGRCHLRMDDTNPTTEDMEYVDAIKRDIQWLGFDWGDHLYFASDYFDRLFDVAVELIEKGKAYVDSSSEAEIRAYRGSITEPGKLSPHRDRSIEENLDLFRRMREGEFGDGAHVLRAKIDMASPNMKMRDPLIYRIKHAAHYRTGKEWCIYPLYDFTHCLSDSFEGITHSICTLEFENNRELYDWVLDNATVDCHPQQIEFARLALSYTVMSKRKLLQLVNEKRVSGWDDPRMPTVAAMRRGGVPAAALRQLADMVGVAKNNSVVDIGKLEFCIRDTLNQVAPRVMAVLEPLEVVITNCPEDRIEQLDAPFFPSDVGKEGSRPLPFSRVIYIEKSDFMENPPKKFFRLAPEREVRLRYAYVIKCDEVIRDEAGAVVQLRCSYDPDTLDKNPAGRKVRGTIHWVSAGHAVEAEVRLYDRLFDDEMPDGLENLNPNSLDTLSDCKLEPSVASAEGGDSFQFERQGYFCVDGVESKPGALVFNRTVSLRDSWAKEQAKQAGASAPHAARPERPTKKQDEAKAPAEPRRAPALSSEAAARAASYTSAHGLGETDAHTIASSDALRELFDRALAEGATPRTLANWLVNEVARELKTNDRSQLDGAALASLVGMVDAGRISATSGKQLLALLVAEGGDPAAIVKARGLEQLGGTGIEPLIDEVLAAHPDEVARFREGKTQLMGFFVGQVMRKAKGKADAQQLSELLKSKLSEA